MSDDINEDDNEKIANYDTHDDNGLHHIGTSLWVIVMVQY